MHGDEPLSELFEDLEQQAAGLHLAERDAELAERAAGEYASVDLAGRLHASVGRSVTVQVRGVGPVDGTLRRVGAGWFLLDTSPGSWVVTTSAVQQVRGLSPQSVSEPLRGVTARLTLRSVLRGLAEDGATVVVHGCGGWRLAVHVLRVGSDFLDAMPEDAEPAEDPVVVPLPGVAALRTR